MNSCYRHIILVLLFNALWFSIPMLNSQCLTARKYGFEDGLENIYCHSTVMMPDTNFFVIAGSGNVYIFDGYRFTRYVNDSVQFASTSCYYRFKDMVYIQMNRNCYVYSRGKFHKVNSSFQINREFTTYQSDTIWTLDYQGNEYYLDDRNFNFVFYRKLNNRLIKKLNSNNTKYFYRKGSNGFYSIYYMPLITFYSIAGNENKIYQKKFDNAFSQFSFFKKSGIVGNGSTVESTRFEISFASNFGKQWYFYEADNSVKLYNRKIHVNSRPNIYNINDTYAFGATPEGLYRFNRNILFYQSGTNIVSSPMTVAEDNKGKIWIGGYGSGFSVVDKEKIIRRFDKRNYDILHGAYKTTSGEILFFTEMNPHPFWKIKNDVFINLKIFRDNIRVTGFFINNIDCIKKLSFGSYQFGLGVIDTIVHNEIKAHYIDSKKGLKLDNVLTFAEDNNCRIWCGRASQGIAVYDVKKDTAFTWLVNSTDRRSFGVMSMKTDNRGNLWLGTTKGLKFLRSPGTFDIRRSSPFRIAQSIKLPDGDSSTVAFMTQVDNFIVAGSQKSVSFIDLNSFYSGTGHPLIYQLIYGEDLEGKGSAQNTVLFDSQRRLWIGSLEGVSMIDWDNFSFDTTKNKIRVFDIFAGSKKIEFQGDKLIIPVDNRNLNISFGPAKNPSMLKNIFFSYYLIKNKSDTLISKEHDQKGEFNAEYLPPGNYNLIIKAFKHGQLMDTMSIAIKSPYALGENPWFWTLLSGIFVLGIGGYLYNRNLQKRKDMQKDLEFSNLRNERNLLQIQSIISTFNPHFINNSLHWVQSKYRKDPETVILIGRLSENIAYIFRATKEGKAFHTLGEELGIVKNYLEIQKIRFKESLNVIVPGDESIEKYRNVPIIILQLQIHLENAIEHGLRNNETGGYVKLQINEDENNIIYIIEDNGVGRKKAANIGSQGTQSGIEMLKKLHMIFNQANTNKITQIYEDEFVEGPGNERCGTRVTIMVPKDYSYSLE
ncbi:MAG: histidine kinase [Saprospiraceae bacterium]|nr:histidine kinase [Saprospiraceae bacterium]